MDKELPKTPLVRTYPSCRASGHPHTKRAPTSFWTSGLIRLATMNWARQRPPKNALLKLNEVKQRFTEWIRNFPKPTLVRTFSAVVRAAIPKTRGARHPLHASAWLAYANPRRTRPSGNWLRQLCSPKAFCASRKNFCVRIYKTREAQASFETCASLDWQQPTLARQRGRTTIGG